MTLFHQSDSDTSESSDSEDELLSAVLEQSSTEHLSDEPRRITRVRVNLTDALLAAFTILRAVRPGCGPYAPMTTRNQAGIAVASRRSNANLEDPWKVLESSVVCMSKNLKDKRIREIPEIVAGLGELSVVRRKSDTELTSIGVFDHLCRQLLEPLSMDRRYVKETLIKSEAKSVRPFIKQLDMLRQSDLLLSVPLAVRIYPCIISQLSSASMRLSHTANGAGCAVQDSNDGFVTVVRAPHALLEPLSFAFRSAR